MLDEAQATLLAAAREYRLAHTAVVIEQVDGAERGRLEPNCTAKSWPRYEAALSALIAAALNVTESEHTEKEPHNFDKETRALLKAVRADLDTNAEWSAVVNIRKALVSTYRRGQENGVDLGVAKGRETAFRECEAMLSCDEHTSRILSELADWARESANLEARIVSRKAGEPAQ